jgi:tetratricopeptide (TPR) repeat protein
MEAYRNRALLRAELGDRTGAMADLNAAIRIEPNNAIVFNRRANLKSQMGDKPGALADYDQAIQLDPNYAAAYYNRAVDRANAGDKPGAMADFRKASALAQRQGNTRLYELAVKGLQDLRQQNPPRNTLK